MTLSEIYTIVGKSPFWADFKTNSGRLVVWEVYKNEDKFFGKCTEDLTSLVKYQLGITGDWSINDKTYKNNFEEIISL